jgi:hypothetical protein
MIMTRRSHSMVDIADIISVLPPSRSIMPMCSKCWDEARNETSRVRMDPVARVDALFSGTASFIMSAHRQVRKSAHEAYSGIG